MLLSILNLLWVMMLDFRVLALIPAYNEAPRIGPVVTKAREYLPVVVVDDGSTDETAVTAKSAGAAVLTQTPNQGKGAALKRGFRWALDEGYEAAIALDADGQHDPAEIPKFLASYQDHRSDLVVGMRNFKQMPLIRRAANTWGGYIFSWALGERVHDNQSGYRLLSQRMLTAVLASQEAGFEFELDMIITCVERGYRLDWVPIRTIYAGEGSHIDNRAHFVNFWRVVGQARRRVKQ